MPNWTRRPARQAGDDDNYDDGDGNDDDCHGDDDEYDDDDEDNDQSTWFDDNVKVVSEVGKWEPLDLRFISSEFNGGYWDFKSC